MVLILILNGNLKMKIESIAIAIPMPLFAAESETHHKELETAAQTKAEFDSEVAKIKAEFNKAADENDVMTALAIMVTTPKDIAKVVIAELEAEIDTAKEEEEEEVPEVKTMAHSEIIHAYADGKVIEAFNTQTGNWVVVKHPRFLPQIEYRIQAEQVDLSGVVFPWEYLNPKFNFIAKDEDGLWFAFVDMPTVENNFLVTGSDYTLIDEVVPEDFSRVTPNFTCVKRPK